MVSQTIQKTCQVRSPLICGNRGDFLDYSGQQDTPARRAAKILATRDHQLCINPARRFGNVKEFARSSQCCSPGAEFFNEARLLHFSGRASSGCGRIY
jgi:hypothetical protein